MFRFRLAVRLRPVWVFIPTVLPSDVPRRSGTSNARHSALLVCISIAVPLYAAATDILHTRLVSYVVCH